jgi:hypothetical protein
VEEDLRKGPQFRPQTGNHQVRQLRLRYFDHRFGSNPAHSLPEMRHARRFQGACEVLEAEADSLIEA